MPDTSHPLMRRQISEYSASNRYSIAPKLNPSQPHELKEKMGGTSLSATYLSILLVVLHQLRIGSEGATPHPL